MSESLRSDTGASTRQYMAEVPCIDGALSSGDGGRSCGGAGDPPETDASEMEFDAVDRDVRRRAPAEAAPPAGLLRAPRGTGDAGRGRVTVGDEDMVWGGVSRNGRRRNAPSPP